MDPAAAWMALLSLPGLGRRRVWRLAEALGGPVAAWHAPVERWERAVSAPHGLMRRAAAARRDLDPERMVLAVRDQGIQVVAWGQPGYPRRLQPIADPPLVLYHRGSMPSEDVPWVAVVGSRQATSYGVAVAHRLAADMAALGWVVVSGLAQGIDAAAHRGALSAGGLSVAVLGHGVDRVYPPAHGPLAQRLAAQGWLVSEYPPGTPAEPFRFPERNRILAGLVDGVVVVEAGPKSGALVTADWALTAGRPVMAVPGPVHRRQGLGTLELLKAGAPPVAQVDDILDVLRDHGGWEVGGGRAGAGPERAGADF